tara:strand:+ start:143 stop:1015 length:873 start_codon:yes stop_codon:yes gene_type:complete
MTLVARLSILFIFLLAGCSQEKVQIIQGSIYGTTYSVQFTENINKEKIHTLIKAELDRIDMVFSTYKPSSEVSLINDCRREFTFGGELFDYQCSKELGSEEFNALLTRANYFFFVTDMAFHAGDERSAFPNTLLPMDFSAIGKGYAVDKIAELLAENGIFNYFIDIGGELSINGTKFGELWTWGISNPINPNSTVYRGFDAPVNGISIATSGEYRNPDHIWGKGSGRERDVLSVTTISENTADADAWATAMYVLGIEDGLKLAERRDVAVFFIKEDGKSVNSTEWSKIYP